MESLLLSLPDTIAPLSLFILSFLAASLLPLGSEWFLIYLLSQGNSSPLLLVSIASVGNYLGAATNYFLGSGGSTFITKKIIRVNDQQLIRAKTIWAKYGSWSLLFSWLPIVGDPLCLIAGLLKMPFIKFSILVFLGKLCRYSIVAVIALQLV